jgi:cell division protein FtsA
VIPVGGDHITNDLACVLRIPISKAEAVKREVSLDENPESLVDELEFENRGKRFVCTVKEVVDVIACRLEELFGTLVSKEIAESGVTMLPAGIVLTGGVAKTDGIDQFISQVVDLPVRIAQPLDIHRMPPGRNGLEYAAASGVIRYVLEKERNAFRYLEPVLSVPGAPVSDDRTKRSSGVKKTPQGRTSFQGIIDSIKKALKELF